uniref:BURP domain-containing protein n=1 Tax=Leersia perrieri TaxID=77586 RepID=A0A0D9WPL4_9ORYZ
MAVLVSLISLILLIGGSSGSSMAPAVAIPSPTAMDYWRKLFPETSMPSAILELLTSMPAAGEELKEVSVSYGPKGEEKESKFLPMKNRSNNKNENYFQKEELKEVSVSYGGEGEDSQKAFPTGQYKLDKENKKSLYNTKKAGLKEESVSYGSEFEEEPRKAFPTGQYVLDKEHENNLNTKKEELKEVTVSYGSKSNLYPTDYGHKKDIHSSTGLKEVSVSYGSDGEKEPRKEIPTGQYMIHSEHGKNLPANKGLKEVSVSYGSEGEDEPRKETPMGQHMLDKEQTKNQRANKQEVREVSVSYGPGYEHKKYIYSTEAGLREVSVSYGSEGEEEPRNAIPTRHYMLDMANRNNVAANKEELREVSVSYGPAHEHKKYIYSTKGPKEVLVSYGSEGEAEPRKVTPTIPYMLDKEHGKNVWTDKVTDELREVSVSYSPGFEHKKYIYSTEARLKEVSVSYGSGGEERPRKASPTGQYMFDKEQEKNTQANKEELREVFVSYIPGYGHKKYIYSSEGGLKEVSVSYGSDGEEEPKETFSVGQYILDKEHDNSMRTDIDGSSTPHSRPQQQRHRRRLLLPRRPAPGVHHHADHPANHHPAAPPPSPRRRRHPILHRPLRRHRRHVRAGVARHRTRDPVGARHVQPTHTGPRRRQRRVRHLPRVPRRPRRVAPRHP